MVKIEGEVVTMSLDEYEEFLRSQAWERALRYNGVDNWEWYGEAMQSYGEELEMLGLDDED